MQIKTNFQQKIEGHKWAVFRLKKLSVDALPGLCTLNIFEYEISLSCGKFRSHHREPLFGHGNTFDRGQPVVRGMDSLVPNPGPDQNVMDSQHWLYITTSTLTEGEYQLFCTNVRFKHNHFEDRSHHGGKYGEAKTRNLQAYVAGGDRACDGGLGRDEIFSPAPNFNYKAWGPSFWVPEPVPH